jgi:glycerophosphoryl diester phosphodiesterase
MVRRFQIFVRSIMFFTLFVVLAWAFFVYSDGFYNSATTTQSVEIMPYQSRPFLYNDDGNEFTVIAHRGASAYAPENTMAAFKKAVEMRAEMIELDVLMSADGVVLCFHDAELDRLTNASGRFTSFSSDSLLKLDAGSWFDSRFAGEPIPTLDEVLAYTKDKIAVNIEIKTESVTDSLKNGIEQKVLELVYKYELLDHVIFSSFDYRALQHIRQLEPAATTAVLYAGPIGEIDNPVALVEYLQADAFNCSWRDLTDEWQALLNDNGIPFNIYTVNDQEKMKEIIAKGAKGIFSDYPDLLLKASIK